MNETILKKLQNELNRRRKSNPNYSMRAFARHLGMSPSMISRILNGKAPVTKKLLLKVRNVIKLTDEEYLFFLEEIEKRKRYILEDEALSNHRQLVLEEFNLIQDWYNMAIFELIRLDDFEPNEDWISKKLSIPKELAQIALRNLIALELVSFENGILKKSSDSVGVARDDLSSDPVKIFQKQVLLRGLESLDLVCSSKRDHASKTIAVDSNLIPQIKIKIKKMKRYLVKYIETNSKKKDQVYELSILLFPWSE